ncbi:MAG: GFA family protein [Acidithiobacillus sp.]
MQGGAISYIFWLCYIMPAIRVVGQKTANPSLKFAPSGRWDAICGAPLSYTLGPTEMPRYIGSCHCGAVRFEIETVIDRVTECNCSICHKKGTGRKTLFLSSNSWGPIECRLSELASFRLGEANTHIFTNAPAAPRCLRPRFLTSYLDDIL